MTQTTKNKAIILDMDGTIVDNMHFHRKSWIGFLKKHSIFINEDQFQAQNHGTINEMITRFFGAATGTEKIKALGLEKEALYRDLYQGQVEEIKDFTIFLKKLKEKGFKIALATMGNKDNIDFTLSAINVTAYFDVIVGGDDVTRGKPDPSIYLKAIELLDADVNHSFAFEDSPGGIQSAKTAGLKVIGITTSHSKEELVAYGCIDAFKDFQHFNYTIFN
ncbi:HAD family hydrolase [Gynurincola endophyticus]|uniref:HAD family hydrolase n=1 Tax=Gynurincola endophyticus TaxID=2479004 RepID=UPI000F8C3F47|nr:HAD family phosphatase [Gynurincola endophyticus]